MATLWVTMSPTATADFRNSVRSLARMLPSSLPCITTPVALTFARTCPLGPILQGDPGRLRHHRAGLGPSQPFHHHPAGQDQGLGPGPARSQTPGHQELIEADFGVSGFDFQFPVLIIWPTEITLADSL